MAKMQANQMRAGMVIEFEGQRYTIIRQNIMIPGKGNAIIQVDMRNIKTGSKKDQRWRTADVVERLETSDEEFTFSYAEGDNIILMHPRDLRADHRLEGHPRRPPALPGREHDRPGPHDRGRAGGHDPARAGDAGNRRGRSGGEGADRLLLLQAGAALERRQDHGPALRHVRATGSW